MKRKRGEEEEENITATVSVPPSSSFLGETIEIFSRIWPNNHSIKELIPVSPKELDATNKINFLANKCPYTFEQLKAMNAIRLQPNEDEDEKIVIEVEDKKIVIDSGIGDTSCNESGEEEIIIAGKNDYNENSNELN